MAVIALTSASGSPGVTTTAVGLAMSWPRPVVLVEADPTGGSGILAGFFRGVRDYEAGLFELALAPVGVADALAEVTQRVEKTQVSFVAGTRSHLQSAGLREMWEPLANALADLELTGQDVIVDAGRLGLAGSPEPLLAVADLTLLVTRTSLPALSAARSWADSLVHGSLSWRLPGLLVIGEGQPYPAKTIAEVLELPVLAKVADDPDGAAVYYQGAEPPRRFETSPFVRSLRAAVESLQATIARSRFELLDEVSS